MPANANGEEKQLINKDKPDDASLASEPSAIAEKREDYETLSPVVPPVTEKEERGPIKDRSCTDVLCLGENWSPKENNGKLSVYNCQQVCSSPFSLRGQVFEKDLTDFRKNGKWFFFKGYFGVLIWFYRCWCLGISIWGSLQASLSNQLIWTDLRTGKP